MTRRVEKRGVGERTDSVGLGIPPLPKGGWLSDSETGGIHPPPYRTADSGPGWPRIFR